MSRVVALKRARTNDVGQQSPVKRTALQDVISSYLSGPIVKILLVGERTRQYDVHKALLVARSPFLKRLLDLYTLHQLGQIQTPRPVSIKLEFPPEKHRTEVTGHDRIMLRDYDVEAFEGVLHWMYSLSIGGEKISLQPNDLPTASVHFYHTARTLEMVDLELAIVERLKEGFMFEPLNTQPIMPAVITLVDDLGLRSTALGETLIDRFVREFVYRKHNQTTATTSRYSKDRATYNAQATELCKNQGIAAYLFEKLVTSETLLYPDTRGNRAVYTDTTVYNNTRSTT